MKRFYSPKIFALLFMCVCIVIGLAWLPSNEQAVAQDRDDVSAMSCDDTCGEMDHRRERMHRIARADDEGFGEHPFSRRRGGPDRHGEGYGHGTRGPQGPMRGPGQGFGEGRGPWGGPDEFREFFDMDELEMFHHQLRLISGMIDMVEGINGIAQHSSTSVIAAILAIEETFDEPEEYAAYLVELDARNKDMVVQRVIALRLIDIYTELGELNKAKQVVDRLIDINNKGLDHKNQIFE